MMFRFRNHLEVWRVTRLYLLNEWLLHWPTGHRRSEKTSAASLEYSISASEGWSWLASRSR